MKPSSLRHSLLAAAAVILIPTAATAQEDVKERVEDLAEQANDVQEQAGALANDLAATEATAARDGEDGAVAGDGTGAGAEERDEGDGDSGKWGLLGLLGLAGLLGLKRRDNRVHTDHDRRI